MKKKNTALHLKGRLTWVLTAALVVSAAAPTVAASATRTHREGDVITSWASYHPSGWSAGSVTRGTGYWRPGASRRVREVQRRLDRLGYRSGEVDGLFGPITQAAVRQYQRDRALQADGIVGPQTLSDLRSRTRRAQRSLERQTSATHTTAWASRNSSESPGWWTIAPLFAAALAVALVAGGFALRALDAMGGAGTARRRGGGTAAAIAAGSRRPGSRPLEPVATALSAAASLGDLRLVPAIAGADDTPPGRHRRSGPRAAPRARSGRSSDGGRGSTRLRLLGANVQLAEAEGTNVPGTVLVVLRLFVDAGHKRWETGLVGDGTRFQIPLADLEDTVRALVVPDCLQSLVDVLGRDGVQAQIEDLAKLPFGVEPSIEVERAIARREVLPIAG
jgi:hypothetical protein